MAETMIERVAKAIVETDHAAEGLTHTELSRAMARAAIETMREPSETMLDAGTAAFERDDFHMSTYHCFGVGFTAAIDAALSEGGE